MQSYVPNKTGYFESKIERLKKIKDIMYEEEANPPEYFSSVNESRGMHFVMCLIRALDGYKSSLLYIEETAALVDIFNCCVETYPCVDSEDLLDLVGPLTVYTDFDYHKSLIDILYPRKLWADFSSSEMYERCSHSHMKKAIGCLNSFYDEHATIEPVADAINVMITTPVWSVEQQKYVIPRINIGDFILEAIAFLQAPIEDQLDS